MPGQGHKMFLALFLTLFLLVIPVNSGYSTEGEMTPGPNEYYQIPEDRLPLMLLFNSTHDEATDNDVVSTIELSLSEPKTNKTVQGVTYILSLSTLESGEINTEGDKISEGEPFMTDLFFAENGTLTLYLAEGDSQTQILNGIQEDFLHAWVSNKTSNSPMKVSSPQINENATYVLKAEIFTVDGVRNVLASDDVPKLQFRLDTQENMSSAISVVPEFPLTVLISIGAFAFVVIGGSMFCRKQCAAS
jgi:hypothetical protein